MAADIEIQGDGRGSLRLDGHDVSKAVRGFKLTGEPGQITRLEIDLMVFEGAKVSGEVDVHIPQDVTELLERLGWTPPTP